MFHLTTHTTHFISLLYGVGYVVKGQSDRLCMGYSFRVIARDLIYHDLRYTSRGVLAEILRMLKPASNVPSVHSRYLELGRCIVALNGASYVTPW